jgi:hypothetical protein
MMLDPHPPAAEEAWHPTGRPVRWFVATCVTVALVATAVWWAGLVEPRLVTGSGLATQVDTRTGDGLVHMRLRNDGPLSVRITGVSLPAAGADRGDVRFLLPDPDPHTFGEPGAQPFTPFTLAAGQAAELQLAVKSDPCPNARLRVRARSPLGLSRTQEFGVTALYGGFGC